MTRRRVSAVRAAVLAGVSLISSTAFAECGPLPGGGESSLQDCLDEWLGPAEVVLSDRRSDGSDAHWISGERTSSTIVLELAEFSNTNRFGLYDPYSNASVQLFSGGNGDGTTRTIEFVGVDGGYDVYVNDERRGDRFTSLTFGFYLLVRANETTYYSDSARNADGADHMYAFQGTGQPFRGTYRNGRDEVDGLPESVEGTVFSPADYILAWEDLPNGGDGDYQDFVVLVRDVMPVPLPSAVWLFATGLIGLAGVARRSA